MDAYLYIKDYFEKYFEMNNVLTIFFVLFWT